MHKEHQHALVLSGAGRFADDWHPFPQTSAALADILAGDGYSVEITEDIDERMIDLSEVELLIVNVGNPGELSDADAAARAGLLAYVGRGGPILALHSSATSFPGIPEWESILGGIWVRGITMHPPLGPARVRVYPERHTIVAPLTDFTVEDERYSFLRVADDQTVLATHEFENSEHPLIWARDVSTGRVVYDALGHDTRSYEAREHQQLIMRAARWLVGDL